MRLGPDDSSVTARFGRSCCATMGLPLRYNRTTGTRFVSGQV